MRAAERRWLDGSLIDPAERYRCSIFDALAAVFVEGGIDAAATGGLFAAGEAGADAGITAGIDTGIAAGVGDAAGLAGFGADALGGATGGLTTGLDAALATPLTTAPISVTPLASEAVPAGTSVGGALAPAEAVPASVGASPTAVGDLSAGAGEFGGPGGGVGGFGGGTSPSLDFGGGGVTSGGGGGGGLTGGLDKALSGIGLNTKDLSTIGSVGGLGMNLLNRNKPIPGEKQLNQAAGSLTATAAAQANEGRTLENYLTSGTLPPGIQQGLTSAVNAATASIRAQHASRGTSGSSAEAQDIQNAQDRAVAAGQSIALQLLQQGATMTGMAVNTESLAANLYSEIMKEALAQDQELGKAIGNFASSIGGGGGTANRGITINTTAA